jgi:hypothetical protein
MRLAVRTSIPARVFRPPLERGGGLLASCWTSSEAEPDALGIVGLPPFPNSEPEEGLRFDSLSLKGIENPDCKGSPQAEKLPKLDPKRKEKRPGPSSAMSHSQSNSGTPSQSPVALKAPSQSGPPVLAAPGRGYSLASLLLQRFPASTQHQASGRQS